MNSVRRLKSPTTPALPRRLKFEPLEGRRLLATLFRINAGGPEISGSPDWQADTLAAPSPFSNAASGGNSGTFATTTAINMTHASIPAGTPMALFHDERFDKPTGANMLWDFPVTAGQYEVRLYFAETWSGAFTNGVRVFDVTIEGVTVLDNYDVFADVGGNKGVVKSFIVNSDGNLDIDFLRGVQNPTIKAIEILSTASAPGTLTPSATALNFGTVAVGQTASQTLTLVNTAAAGGPSVTINPGAATVTPSGQPFTVNWGQSTPIVLAPGQAKQVTVNYAPTSVASHAATLTIPHSGTGSPLQISLSGSAAAQVPISFAKSVLGNTTGLDRPTSIQFGPDGRLYVAQQNGLIRAYTVVKTAANDYDVTAVENITHVQQITNHNDDGAVAPTITTRLVTGILVTGTAANPVMYVNSSDPRIGGGSTGADLNLDTNSSTVSRLTKSGATWTKVDLVRGLPRSEENHHANGMQLDAATNTLYVAMGGNTNMGATSNNFSFLPEFALSAAILSIDLDAIGNTTYNLPTLDDETRATNNDANDPFGGNDGRNQAIIVPGGPVQVYAPGFRNAYDLLIHSNGKMFTVDNGANAGWGDVPIGEGPNGTATNGVNEPGVSYGDGLHHITGPGYYGGHPNPTRANRSNTFNTSNPQSPVPVANPIEGDFRAPGAENGSLVVFPTSSNGMVEYTTNNFGGAMKGDILVAVFDNTIKRVKLNAAGQVVLSENLFTNVGFRPLDITAPATGPFAGTLWVCDVAQGTITVFEPTTSGGGDPDDLDGDGYTNADEIANGTDPNSPADVPPDFDADFISNLTDPNDDNDSFSDTVDKFAVDGANGASTPIGAFYGWENEGENLGGLLGMGFTGVMTNGTSNYASLFDPSKVTAGGAAGVFTIDSALAGTAKGAANSQQQAFQFGVNVGGATGPFVARSSIVGPFNGVTPQAGQEMGFYIGTGDQDNFIQIVVSGDNGGSIKLGKEVSGAFTAVASQNLSTAGVGFIELRLTINPTNDTLQASYSVEGGPFVNLGGPTAVPASWLASVMAVGLIATDPTDAGDLPVTWDYLGVESATPVTGNPQALLFIEGLGGDLQTASVFESGSFRLTNQSTGNVRIQSVTIDASTSILPDVVFDPLGDGGNDVFKPFTPDEGATLTGLLGHSHGRPNGGGFETLTIDFDNFDPGEQFVFSIDMEPTSIKGSEAPGPSQAGKISGMEMTGSTVTVVFSDGTTTTSQTYRTAGNNRASQTIADTGLPPTPGLTLLGSVTPPAHVSTANQTVRITGPAGATARLFHIEASLHLAGVPNGGFDLDPFEANKATSLTDLAVTIGAGGFVDVPIVLTKSGQEGGYNYITAVIQDALGRTSDNAPKIVLAYNVSNPPNPGSGAAKVEVYSQGAIANSSTARVDSFRFHNNSADGREISSISVNLNTSFMPDVVYDPSGSAGDVVGIAFTPDTGGAATGQSTHQFSLPRDGGFDKLEVFFTDFDPGETFTFHVDIDPTSVKGSAQPGPAHAASISGLELSGATVTVRFEDGGSMTGQLFALDEGTAFYKVHSEIVINEAALPAAPSLLAVGVGAAPAIVGLAAQTIRISGPVGASVRLLQTETALHLADVPGGGFDIDAFEANKVVFVRDDVRVIGAGGFVDVPVTLRDSLVEGGLNYFVAVVDLPDGRTSSVSNVIKLALNNLPPGSNPGAAPALETGPDALHSAGDYSGDGVVDGTDFLTWQRALGSTAEPLGSGADGDGSGVVDGDDLAMWQEQFGAVAESMEEVGASSSVAALSSESSSEFTASAESMGINVDLSDLWRERDRSAGSSLIGVSRGAKHAIDVGWNEAEAESHAVIDSAAAAAIDADEWRVAGFVDELFDRDALDDEVVETVDADALDVALESLL